MTDTCPATITYTTGAEIRCEREPHDGTLHWNDKAGVVWSSRCAASAA